MRKERDIAYGTAMLALRTTIGMTRSEFANRLCVSRQTVGEWETGRSYPKAQHLKKVITLAVEQQAFPVGREAAEIKALWKVAHQKVLLDERWLSALLSQGTVGTRTGASPVSTAPVRDITSGPRAPAASPRADWGEALTIPTFYGREEELSQLTQWMLQERCRVVSVLGMGGIGKSALVVSLMYRLAEHFEVVIFRSLRDAPSCEALIDDCLQVLSPQSLGQTGRDRTGAGQGPDRGKPYPALSGPIRPLPLRHPFSSKRRGDPSSPTGRDRTGAGQGQALSGPIRPLPLRHPYSFNRRGDPSWLPSGRDELLPPGDVSTKRRISELVEHLRKTRTLVVLDNLESLLEPGDVRGHLRPGFEGYAQLLHRLVETDHQSCLLITSREKPAELRLLEGRYPQIRSLHLTGLDVAACQQILEEKGIASGFTPGVGTKEEAVRLIGIYGGNPLALKIMAETIIDLFAGEIGPFPGEGTVVFGDITVLLSEHFARLSVLEQTVLCWLAILREPVTLDELLQVLVTPLPRVQLFEAIDSLHRRSLIERGKRAGSFTLHSVVLEYVTEFLIAEVSREIQQRRLNRLIQHGLELAHTKEYVRQTQERLLLFPLLKDLQSTIGRGQAPPVRPADGARRKPRTGSAQGTGSTQGTIPTVPMEEELLGLLDQLRGLPEAAQGYGAANLIALLRLQRGNLNGLDLSKLCIRMASLQGIQMQEASLAGSLIRDTVFTEAVSATWGVAISKDGTLWAASGMQGQVRVWTDGGQTLRLIWQAHTDMVQALAFSPNGRMLASGSHDGTVKLWDMEACNQTASVETSTASRPSSHGPPDALLWMSWQNSSQNLAFSPDGGLLAGTGMGTTVPLWDTQSGTTLQTLTHPAHVFAIAWSPDGRLLASSCVDGRLRLWERRKTEPATKAPILQFSTSWETSPAWSLAFAPDGKTLAIADWDQKVRLWEVASGRLLHTFEGETNKTNRVVWSPDGRTLACSSYEKAIWLWDVAQRRHRATLSGHTSDINGIVFTPDSRSLLSGSADSTLRVWDVQSGQCMRVMQGYAISLYALDWSPDGTHLISGGTDGLVTIWDLSEATPPRELSGHTWIVRGVGWSPNGKLVASSGWDEVMRLWDAISHTLVQIFRDPSTMLVGMAWNPNGRLLAVTTFLEGMCVWDITKGRRRWVGEPGQTTFLSAAWHPDGSLLAGGADNGNVYLWEGTDGTLIERLPGHDGNVMSVAWSPDGRLLASGGNKLFVWDVQSIRAEAGQGQVLSATEDQSSARLHPLRTFEQHPDRVYAVAWSRSHGADQLISGGSGGSLYWWDVQSGECICTRSAHQGTIRALRVSPDGRRLASCGDDGAIRIWDLESFEHLQTLRHKRPYEQLNITGIRGLTEAQKSTLQALGATEEVVP